MAEDHSFNKTEYFGNGSGQSNMFPVRVRSINLTEMIMVHILLMAPDQ